MQKWLCGVGLVLCVLVADVARGTTSDDLGTRVEPPRTDVALPEDGIILIQEGEDLYALPAKVPGLKDPLVAQEDSAARE